MTLEKYEEEKRKGLLALKTEERKDKKKELPVKEEIAKKSVSINEFLKPADGERYYSPGGRGRDRGRGT
ncbi:hypothetical protein ACS0TY_018842 [Phlomoides rotata]